MNRKILAAIISVAIASSVFVSAAIALPSSAQTSIIGNDTNSRTQVDTASNFVVIDTNHPALASGEITSFGYYASNTNPFRFVVVGSNRTVKYVSPQITPTATGANTYTPTNPISVATGDNIGAYFSSTGTIPFENTGASAYWVLNSGVPEVGATLSNQASGARTYSMVAYSNAGTTPPTMPNINFHGFTYGKVDYDAGGVHRFATFFVQSTLNRFPFAGSGTFIYQDASNNWYVVRISRVAIEGQDAYFAGRVTQSSNPGWVNQWLYAKVHDAGNGQSQIWGSFMTASQASAHFTQRNNLTDPPSGAFNITSGGLVVVPELNFQEIE